MEGVYQMRRIKDHKQVANASVGELLIDDTFKQIFSVNPQGTADLMVSQPISVIVTANSSGVWEHDPWTQFSELHDVTAVALSSSTALADQRIANLVTYNPAPGEKIVGTVMKNRISALVASGLEMAGGSKVKLRLVGIHKTVK